MTNKSNEYIYKKEVYKCASNEHDNKKEIYRCANKNKIIGFTVIFAIIFSFFLIYIPTFQAGTTSIIKKNGYKINMKSLYKEIKKGEIIYSFWSNTPSRELYKLSVNCTTHTYKITASEKEDYLYSPTLNIKPDSTMSSFYDAVCRPEIRYYYRLKSVYGFFIN